MVEEDCYDISLQNRNGQSACNEEDFAELLAARLNDNSESQFDDPSILPEVTAQLVPLPTTSKVERKDLGTAADVHAERLVEHTRDGKSSTVIKEGLQQVSRGMESAYTATTQPSPRATGYSPKKDNKLNKKREHNYQLQNAAESGKIERIRQLLDINELGDLAADINAKGLDDFTALHFAVSEGHYESVQELLKHNPNIEATTRILKTPLHMACGRGDLRIMKALVKAGANVDAQDEDGNTPSHTLASLGLCAALEWMLEQRPNLAAKNIYGESPVDTSANLEVRRVFEKRTKVASRSSYSRTVMDGVLLHNNRADRIKSFMFRAQLMGQTADAKIKEEIKVEPKVAHKTHSRVVKILEVVNKIKSEPVDEQRTLEKKEVGEDEEASTDDFEPLNLLGRGAFGEVYLVKHKGTGKLYALKVLDKRRIKSQSILRYTKTERDVLCVTKHPFIVGLHYAFQNSEKLYMIMQYCPGYFFLSS